jgi:hypothetical protein
VESTIRGFHLGAVRRSKNAVNCLLQRKRATSYGLMLTDGDSSLHIQLDRYYTRREVSLCPNRSGFLLLPFQTTHFGPWATRMTFHRNTFVNYTFKDCTKVHPSQQDRLIIKCKFLISEQICNFCCPA